jgi:hypothetical protein
MCGRDDRTPAAQKGRVKTVDKSEQLAVLGAQAHMWILRGREANLELGRLLLQIKAILKHGRRQPRSCLRESPAQEGKNDE